MQDMDWDDVRLLLALQRKGSLAGAAKLVRVDQTTVGRRLTALEQRLGSRLFERHPTGHRLTTTGLRACELARGMEDAALAIERELGGRDSAIEGTVRITAPSGIVPVVATALVDLRQAHPRVSFELLVDSTAVDLIRRHADIAVRMFKPDQPSLVAQRVSRHAWGLFASPDYLSRRGQPPPDLAGHDVIAFEAPLTTSPGGTWLTKHAKRARVVLRTNHVLGALDCAAAGLGIAAAPAFMGSGDDRLRRLPGPRDLGASQVFLVVPRDTAKIPRVRATLDCLVRRLQERRALSD